ncbi:distal tail protein Dit, partial [Faecalibaculum rodentium]
MLNIKFDGKWLEAQVPGFQVISVSGRELMSYDVNEKKIPGIDGASYTGSEIGSRDIEVTYRLCAPMLEARQIRMNKLNSLLKAREAQLIFADELDKYFIASSAEADGSKIVFHCSDPFKYSTTEKAIPITGNTLTITNNGTV